MTRRIITPLDAIAWSRLVEMRGELIHFGQIGHDLYYAKAPSHETGRCHGVGGDDHIRTLTSAHYKDPADAVADVFGQWVEAGRPTWPVLAEVWVGDEDPDATAHQRRQDEGTVPT